MSSTQVYSESKNEDILIYKRKEEKLKPRYDWYQTNTNVIVTIMIKNVDPQTVSVLYCSQELEVAADEFYLLVKLHKMINPEQCRYKVMSTKIEVTLSKTESVSWNHLEVQQGKAGTPRGKKEKNWDDIANELEKELGSLTEWSNPFGELFSISDEDAQRAMKKSFIESEGTVLISEWKDVKDRYVHRK